MQDFLTSNRLAVVRGTPQPLTTRIEGTLNPSGNPERGSGIEREVQIIEDEIARVVLDAVVGGREQSEIGCRGNGKPYSRVDRGVALFNARNGDFGDSPAGIANDEVVELVGREVRQIRKSLRQYLAGPRRLLIENIAA